MSEANDRIPDALEPCAWNIAQELLAAKKERFLGNDELESLSSISRAQSAKRQADALEAIADRLRDLASGEGILEAFRTPLNGYGEGIGECIQGQLERGNRG